MAAPPYLTKSKVITLREVERVVDHWRNQARIAILDYLHIVQNDGFYAYNIPGPAFQISALEVLEAWAATWGFCYDYNTSQGYACDDKTFVVYLQSTQGGPFHRREFPPFERFYANFYAAALDQNKQRMSGVWRNKNGFVDKRLIRVPWR